MKNDAVLALEQEYIRSYGWLKRRGAARLGDVAAAEDLTQDAFLWGLEQLHGGHELGGGFLPQKHKRLLSCFFKKQRRVSLAGASRREERSHSADDEESTAVTDQENLVHLRLTLQSLASDPEFALIAQSEMAGVNAAAMSAGLNLGAVHVRRTRFRKRYHDFVLDALGLAAA